MSRSSGAAGGVAAALVCLIGLLAGCATGPVAGSVAWGQQQVDHEIQEINALLGIEPARTEVGRFGSSARPCEGVPRDDTYGAERGYFITDGALNRGEALRLMAARYRDLGADLDQFQVSVDGSRVLKIRDTSRGLRIRFRAGPTGSGIVRVTWMPCGIESVLRTGDTNWIREPVAE